MLGHLSRLGEHLGSSWGPLGGYLGRLEAILEATSTLITSHGPARVLGPPLDFKVFSYVVSAKLRRRRRARRESNSILQNVGQRGPHTVRF